MMKLTLLGTYLGNKAVVRFPYSSEPKFVFPLLMWEEGKKDERKEKGSLHIK